MANKKKSSSSKLTYYMKAPYRVLVSARDLYVSSLGGCAGRVQQGRVIPSRVPRSQSHGFFNSRSARGREEDDVAELIRAASQGRLGPMGIRLTDTAGAPMPRSQSVGVAVLRPPAIGRIDEAEEGSDVDGSSHGGGSYPRSRSCAVVPTGRVVVVA
ncbi:uncharacterized protein M6B38_143090 [Iris pallida]|uniref:Uncharacterized protein n=1 Tax=Iris pallida TaxID=29817 RepID=A0AAX6FBT2_IRIPA|nr:uncharacterized protein M6B38_143090 [Iris pallida]